MKHKSIVILANIEKKKIPKYVLDNQIILLNFCMLQKDKKTRTDQKVKMGPFAGSYKDFSEQDHEAPQPVPRRG